MGCGSVCVVKELVMQSRLDGGFWISSIYARISEFVPTFVSRIETPFDRLRAGYSTAQGRPWGTRQFCGRFTKNRQQQVQGEMQGLFAAEIVFLLTLHGVVA